MARNVLKGSYKVEGYDLNPQRLALIASPNFHACRAAQEVARCSDVVITMLPMPRDVREVIIGADGIASQMRPGSLILEMSTIDPLTTLQVAQELSKRGIRMMDAPVARSSKQADEGTLLIMAGGAPNDFAEAQPILACMGNAIHHTGPLGTGVTMKLINNMLTMTIMLADSEALVLGTKAGITLDTMLTVLRDSFAFNEHLRVTFPNSVFRGNFEPGFQVRLGHKDLRLATNMSAELGTPTFLASTVREILGAAVATGRGGRDVTAMITLLEDIAGVRVRAEGEAVGD